MKRVVKENFFKKIIVKIKETVIKIYNARGSAHEIALGAGIGAFWGVFPTFGLSTILSILLYKILRFNLLVAIAAAFISNPITSPFLLLLSYKVGKLFIKIDVKFEYKNWLENIGQIGYVLLTGSMVTSTIIGLLVYFITKYAINYRRTKLNQFSNSRNG